MPDVSIVGVPFDGGAGSRGGASFGPDGIRQASVRLKTTSRRGIAFTDLTVKDCGNLSVRRFDLEGTVAGLRHTYRELFAKPSGIVLTFGGDHSITFPIVSAAAEGRRLGLVWFDAHPDTLDTYQGSSVSHGSPLRRIISSGAVRGEDVVLVGTRAYDEGEVEFIRESGIHELSAAELEDALALSLARYGELLREVAERVDAFYVTVDIDVLDAALVPGTGTPVAGGMSTGLLLRLLEAVPEPVVAYDVVEYAPLHDASSVTEASVLALTTALLGRIAAARNTARGSAFTMEGPR